MTEKTWPKPYRDAKGPIPADKLEGAALGMGEEGPETRALTADGYVPPDIMAGLTLFLLGRQQKHPDPAGLPGAGRVAGGVWVREDFTIHQPLGRNDAFTVRGEALGQYVHKSRRYAISRSQTFGPKGLVATNLTAGLVAYRAEEGLADQVEGLAPDQLESPPASWETAADNPGRTALASLKKGRLLQTDFFPLSLAMMTARETSKPDNPIHSDPEVAKKAGLAKPIAGGSHVLAFALELIMQAGGRMSLLYGASIQTRWKLPVYADARVQMRVRVAETKPDRVVFEAGAELESGAIAMTSRITLPLA